MGLRRQFTYIAAALLAISLASCNDADSPEKDTLVSQQETTLSLNFQIDEMTQGLRLSQWNGNDAVGVYVQESGKAEFLQQNARYVNQRTGREARFYAAEAKDRLQLKNGTSLKITAYYPFNETVKEGIIDLNLSDQSDNKDRDLLTATREISVGSTSPIRFEHKLANIDFTLDGTDADMSQISGTIKGLPATAQYSIHTNQFSNIGKAQDIKTNSYRSSNIKHLSSYIIPTAEKANITVIVKISGKAYNCKISQKFEAGKKYTYNLKVKGGTVEPIAVSYLELPTQKPNEHFKIVSHVVDKVRNYTMGYDTNQKMATWVAYPMHRSYMGKTGRTDAWSYDPLIDPGFQYNMNKGLGVGFDRGHQIPSGDRTAIVKMNKETFYYSNMTAQNSDFNQGQWNNLENKVRDYTNKLIGAGLDTLYMVTGASMNDYVKGSIRITNAQVRNALNTNNLRYKSMAVPTFYFKALAIRTKGGGYKTMAFCLPHKPLSRKGNLFDQYHVSIKELEKLTGIDFFPGIPESAKNDNVLPNW